MADFEDMAKAGFVMTQIITIENNRNFITTTTTMYVTDFLDLKKGQFLLHIWILFSKT